MEQQIVLGVLGRGFRSRPRLQKPEVQTTLLFQGLPDDRSCDARQGRQDLLFFLEHLLSGMDNRRDRLIKAQSGLWSVRNYPRLQRGLSLVLDVPVQILNQG